MPERSERASQHQMQAFFDNLVRELDQRRIPPPGGKARDHAGQSAQHLLPHGADQAGHAHPARRGDGDRRRAARARPRAACSTANRPHACARCSPNTARACPAESGTVRGLARLLRRNPTDAERILWQALTTDRRFAGQFKRQTPVGRHIPDFVSFVKRVAMELVNAEESGGDRAGSGGKEGVAGGAGVSGVCAQCGGCRAGCCGRAG